MKKNNATTGEVRRTMGVMDILDDLVPAASPMINPSSLNSTEDEKALPSSGGTKRRKLDPVDQAIVEMASSMGPKELSDKQIKLELTKAKVELFKSFDHKTPSEIKEVLGIYKDFDI